jgi:hypothetical protein
MPARIDPIFHPGDATVVLRIRGDDGIETEIEWPWERVLEDGASLIEHALAAKRHLKQEDDASRSRGLRHQRARPQTEV